jgi:hypothetical protein
MIATIQARGDRRLMENRNWTATVAMALEALSDADGSRQAA